MSAFLFFQLASEGTMKHMHNEIGHDFLVILDENIVTPFLSLTEISVTRKTKSYFLMNVGQ